MTIDESSRSGLTEKEAQEFHRFFITGFLLFTAIAVVAHVLVWMWRPWLPGENGYSMLDMTQNLSQTLIG